MRFPRALLALAAAVPLAACDGNDPEIRPAGAPEAPGTPYVLRWTGAAEDMPWNRTLYPADARPGAVDASRTAIFFEGDPGAVVAGRPGERWSLLSEIAPNRAMTRLLWIYAAQGEFGEAREIDLPPRPRARIGLTGSEGVEKGADTITVSDEEGGTRLVAVRDPVGPVRFALWDGSGSPEKEDWRVSDLTGRLRPWTWAEVRPGKFAIAARCDGRQWLARRVELRAGATEILDVARQPPGGGTVVCDNPRAELLLGGDLPVPAIRIVQDFYRARWQGVPPGKHAVRYPGGRTVEVTVEDGATVQLPRD